MFFKNFFSKNHGQLIERGDRNFNEGHYAEARQDYLDAREKLPESDECQNSSSHITSMISKCGNNLAEMNIVEAQIAIRSGSYSKALDCLHLSLDLADDVSVREKAENLLVSVEEFQSAPLEKGESAEKHYCSSCTSSHVPTPEPVQILPDHLQSHEQFQLLINTLPGDLPHRYSLLGEEFANTYLLAQTESHSKALNNFRQLLSENENDIILYETALLEYRAGRVDICESLLQRALKVNDSNPVCHLSLAQLFADTGRLDDAALILKKMMQRMILHDQALVMLADIYTMKGEVENAVELLSTGLQIPALKKASAERLVPILSAQGRDDEAAFLVKTYLKGCC